MKFGDRLKQLREEKNVTQKELGNYLNISSRVIGYYESNDRFPKDEIILNKIADYFDVSLDYLLGRSLLRKPGSDIIYPENKDTTLDLSGLSETDVSYVNSFIDGIKAKNKKKN